MPTTRPAASFPASSGKAIASHSSGYVTASSPARSTGRAFADLGIAPIGSERPRLLRRFGKRREAALPQPDAAPLPELPADVAIGTCRHEARRLVQADAGGVGQADRRDRLGEALRLEQRQQGGIERSPDALAMRTWRDIDGRLDAEPVGPPRPERAGIGVAEQLASLVG